MAKAVRRNKRCWNGANKPEKAVVHPLKLPLLKENLKPLRCASVLAVCEDCLLRCERCGINGLCLFSGVTSEPLGVQALTLQKPAAAGSVRI
jgi:hypothetical protein